MKEIDFDKPLLDADGAEQEIKLSKILSDIMMQSVTKDVPYKYFEWGLELRKSGKLTLDSTDSGSLKIFISNSDLFNLPKGRLLEAFN